MNILILSAGSRCQLMKYFQQDKNGFDKVVSTDCSRYAPALYLSDKYYLTPKIHEPNYLQALQDICVQEDIHVILPLNENDLQIMAENRGLFEERGILVAVSGPEAVALCRDKYALFQKLNRLGIPCIQCYEGTEESLAEFGETLESPVFVKPRYGAGSIGNMKVSKLSLLRELIKCREDELILQPYVDAVEYGVDTYIDFESREVIAIFAKEKIRMRAGETEKSRTVIDKDIFRLVQHTVEKLELMGPVDMDIYYYKGEYHILEINPRFGGGYPHAYECGVNFPFFLRQNAAGICNNPQIGRYSDGEVMLKYTDAMMIKVDCL